MPRRVPRWTLAVAAWLLAGGPPAVAQAPDSLPAPAWQRDFRAMVDTLFLGHADAFHARSRAELEDSARAMAARFDQQSRAERIVAMASFLALVGDGHTRMWLYERPRGLHPVGFHRLPIRVNWFEEGLVVVAADSGYRDCLGARVTAVGGVPVQRALDRVAPAISRDNPQGVLQYSPIYLTTPEVLAAVGLAPAGGPVSLRLSGGGGNCATLTLGAAAAADSLRYLPLVDRTGAPRGSGTWRRGAAYEFWREGSAMVAQINQMSNGGTVPLREFLSRLLGVLDSLGTPRLVLDLRYNSGGDATLMRPFIAELARRPAYAKRGGVSVLIGRATFSAGLWNSLDLQRALPVILVGEPTGGIPNGFGETEEYVLPSTGLRMTWATRFNVRSTPDDKRIWLPPDRPVPTRFRDLKAGSDAVLREALR